MASILTIAAHPDDEVLGCGGTIAKLTAAGHSVSVLIFTDGVSARVYGKYLNGAEQLRLECEISERRIAARSAATILGVRNVTLLGLLDQQLDAVRLIELTQDVEKKIKDLKPERVYTHSKHDLNLDHQLVAKAVLTATRPGVTSVREVYAFEVPSSTEWAFNNGFKPNIFEDISCYCKGWYDSSEIPTYLDMKLKALHCYESELRPFPHPRSEEVVRALAAWRGATAGVSAAEAFEVYRIVR